MMLRILIALTLIGLTAYLFFSKGEEAISTTEEGISQAAKAQPMKYSSSKTKTTSGEYKARSRQKCSER